MSGNESLPVKSGPSRLSAHLKFVNLTNRHVNIFWIDFNGRATSYGVMHPGRDFDVHTYMSHPWTCEDRVTKIPMLLNKKEIFFPSIADKNPSYSNECCLIERMPIPVNLTKEQFYHRMNSPYPPRIIKREIVFITMPVFPLKQLSAEVILKNIRNEDIDELEIPIQLKSFLKMLHPFHNCSSH